MKKERRIRSLLDHRSVAVRGRSKGSSLSERRPRWAKSDTHKITRNQYRAKRKNPRWRRGQGCYGKGMKKPKMRTIKVNDLQEVASHCPLREE